MSDISSVSELLLYLFLFFRCGMASQILFLEFLKDGSTVLGDKFTYDGSSNHPVIPLLCESFSRIQVLGDYDQF